MFIGGLSARADSRFVNISSRAFAPADSTGGQSVIAGFVIAGSQPKKVLVRVVGSGLADFGVTDYIRDPKVELVDANGRSVFVTGDAWDKGNFVREGGSFRYTATPAEIYQAFIQSGAFPFKGWRPGQVVRDPLSDSNPYGAGNDRVLLVTLNPGAYSTVISERSPTGGGVLLIEVYEVDQASRLVNISTRAPVFNGSRVLIAGFVVSGPDSRTILIRGIGSGLTRYGVAGTLKNPLLKVFRNGQPLATYGSVDSQIPASQSGIGQSGVSAGAFAPLGSDTAAVVTLSPGVYSAVLEDRDGGVGNGLLELYEVAGNPTATLPLPLPDFTVADTVLGPKDVANNAVSLSLDSGRSITVSFTGSGAGVAGIPGKTSYPYSSYQRTGPVTAILRLAENADGTGAGMISTFSFGQNTSAASTSGVIQVLEVADMTALPYQGVASTGSFRFSTGFSHGAVPETNLAPATFAKVVVHLQYTDGRSDDFTFSNVGGIQRKDGSRTLIALYTRISDTEAGLQVGFPYSDAGPGTVYRMTFGSRNGGSFVGVDTTELSAGPDYPGKSISGTFTVPTLPPTGW
jgi:hypothetical protein